MEPGCTRELGIPQPPRAASESGAGKLEWASDQWRLTAHALLFSKASVASHGQVKTLVLSYKPSTPRPPRLCSPIMLSSSQFLQHTWLWPWRPDPSLHFTVSYTPCTFLDHHFLPDAFPEASGKASVCNYLPGNLHVHFDDTCHPYDYMVPVCKPG